MPNLTLNVDHAQVSHVQAQLDRVTDLMVRPLGASRPNVMLLPMMAGNKTSAIYAELLYLRNGDRPEDAIATFGRALADILSTPGGRLSFRGLPVIPGGIVSVDVETTQ